MTQLYSTAISDTTRFTLSLWFKLLQAPTPSGGWQFGGEIGLVGHKNFSLIAWGYQSDNDETLFRTFSESWCSVSIEDAFMGTNNGFLQLCLGGPYFAPVLQDAVGPEYTSYFTAGSYPQICLIVPFAGAFITNQWHHLLISADTTTPDILTVTDSGGPSYGPVTALRQNSRIGIRLDNILHRADTYFPIDSFGNPSFTPSDMGGASGQYRINMPESGASLSPGDVPYEMSTIHISGTQTAIPAISTYFPDIQHGVRIAYAYVHGWFNQALNIADSGVVSKFLTSDGKPPQIADPLVAVRAFGTPNIYFYRDKQRNVVFQINRGSSGPFSLVGTLPGDYSPGASL